MNDDAELDLVLAIPVPRAVFYATHRLRRTARRRLLIAIADLIEDRLPRLLAEDRDMQQLFAGDRAGTP